MLGLFAQCRIKTIQRYEFTTEKQQIDDDTLRTVRSAGIILEFQEDIRIQKIKKHKKEKK